MSVEPQCGEVWLLDEASVLPGGMLALVVSGPLYNATRARRLVVEVVTEVLPAAGALLAPLPQRLAQLGVAVIGEPMTVPLAWFGHARPLLGDRGPPRHLRRRRGRRRPLRG